MLSPFVSMNLSDCLCAIAFWGGLVGLELLHERLSRH